jgi:hypothetical protein
VSSIEPFIGADLANLVLPSPLYTVLSAIQTQQLGNSRSLYDVLDISFMVTGRAGVFSVQIPLVGFRVFENQIDLTSEANIVNAIYSL